MSLGTIVLLCLAALFFGGIVCLDRINRKRKVQGAGSNKPTLTVAADPPVTDVKGSALPSAGTPAKVMPLARPKKNRSREMSRPQQRHGT